MAMSWLARMAAKAPVPVYPVVGENARDRVQDLELDSAITIVESPRHARLLLVAGGIPSDYERALRQIHDQVPSPMATLWSDCHALPELSTNAVVANADESLSALATRTYEALLTGEHPGEALLCADEPPAPWEGLGDDGHGGEGMMGGKPYGRPMAMPMDESRDGLQLDPMDFTLGPFWPNFPPGLRAKVSLHGDVVASFEILSRPFPTHLPEIFLKALEHPVAIADLELGRARYHLRQLSRALKLNGLESVARKLLVRTTTLEPGASLDDLKKYLRRLGFFASAGAGTGILTDEQLAELDAPADPVHGTSPDPRQDDPNYLELGWHPAASSRKDCRGRWQWWLDEADHALALAGRAGAQNLKTTPGCPVASPRGKLTPTHRPADVSHILEELLPGLEWSEAMATIASLDLAAVEGGE